MSDVNRKIFQLLGGNLTPSVFVDAMANNCPSWIFTPIKGSQSNDGEGFEMIDAVIDTFIEDYQHDMNAAMAAAGELLNYGLCIFLDPADPHITYKNGKRDEFGDLWTRLPVKSNDPADIAAAICAAILQAHESEDTDGT